MLEGEPELQSDPGLDDVLQQLMTREPIFHRLEHGSTRADFEAMTDPDFWEIGASGRRYSRAYVLDELEQRHAAPHADDVLEGNGLPLPPAGCRSISVDVHAPAEQPADDAPLDHLAMDERRVADRLSSGNRGAGRLSQTGPRCEGGSTSAAIGLIKSGYYYYNFVPYTRRCGEWFVTFCWC